MPPSGIAANDWSSMNASEREEIRETLEAHADMSSYEARVYVTLVENGKQSMTEIAAASDVPKQRVYDIIEKLEVRGFVETTGEYPKTAFAVDPAATFDRIQTRVDDAKTSLERLYRVDTTVESAIATFKSIPTIKKHVRDLISSADSSLFVVLPDEFLPVFDDDIAARRGEVSTRLLVSNLADTEVGDDTILLDGVSALADEVRGFESDEALIVIKDRRVGFFWAGESVLDPTSESRGVRIEDRELVFLIDRFVSHSLWPRSKPAEETGTGVSLPAEYIRIRTCLETLNELTSDRPPEDFEITIEGYDTTSRAPVEITGTLVDYDYDPDYITASLTLLPDEEIDGLDREYVTAGGWKASVEDYEARRITIRER